MTKFSHALSRQTLLSFERAASCVVLAWAALAPSTADAETRASIDTSVKADIASNPYLLSGPKTSSASGTVSVSPNLKLTDGTQTVSLRGVYRHTEFSRRYRSNNDLGASASLAQQLTPRLAYNASFGYDSSVVGANDLLTFGTNPGTGVAFPPLPGDIAINGLRQRRHSINGGMSLDYAASSRDQFTAQGGFSIVRFPVASTASEYNNASGSIGYSRIINSTTSVGLDVSLSRADYRHTPLGDATTISPQATFKTKFGASWSLSTSLGVSHSRISSLVGKTTQDSAAGRLSLCNATTRGKFCLFASRSVQPTSFGSTVRPQTSAGLSYNVRLDAKSTVDATASYSRSGQIGQGNIVTGGTVDYGRASLTYNRRLGQRIQGYITADYADSYRDPTPRKANAAVSIGVSFTLGDNR
jgi:hypothetical protein